VTVSVLPKLKQAVIDGEAEKTEELVREALSSGLPPEQVLKEGLIAAMAEVGRLFEEDEYFVPEMLIAARAMKGGLAILRPLLAAANVQAVGKVVIGTVQGDLHDIGKNLVGMMLEGAGFDVVDLGTDVSARKFVEAVRIHQPQFVGCSALLTTTMPRMKDVVAELEQAGLRDRVIVMIGGAPITQQYADEIGADIFAPDAAGAANRARQAVGA
jgi:5-methyltetrahydrofolate--homocysteine methyltransferase